MLGTSYWEKLFSPLFLSFQLSFYSFLGFLGYWMKFDSWNLQTQCDQISDSLNKRKKHLKHIIIIDRKKQKRMYLANYQDEHLIFKVKREKSKTTSTWKIKISSSPLSTFLSSSSPSSWWSSLKRVKQKWAINLVKWGKLGKH